MVKAIQLDHIDSDQQKHQIKLSRIMTNSILMKADIYGIVVFRSRKSTAAVSGDRYAYSRRNHHVDGGVLDFIKSGDA